MTNRVALVTGGAQRIGAQIVRTLHEAGFDIVLHYCESEAPAEALAEELNTLRNDSAKCFAADLNNADSINTLSHYVIEQFGRIDLLVNNASRFYPTPVGNITDDNWDDLINSNVKGALFLCQSLTEQLGQHHGSIINIIDIHADRPLKNHTLYSIAKAALAMMTKSLAKELGPKIRVNGVSPGAILWPENEISEKQQQEILDRIALRKTGLPEDIANTVLFLATSAPYITGQIIAVDGGRSLNC